MSAVPHHHFTPEEYLQIERRAEFKSEYADGEMFAMSGASHVHNTIAFNLSGALYAVLRGGSCRGYSADMRVRIPGQRKYVYPDLSIVCSEPAFEDEALDTLTNPTVVVEILSPSTERYDRRTKFGWYGQIPTLREYVLIAQDEPHVERFQRRGDEWIFTVTDGLDATLRLESIGCDVRLADIYDRIQFASAAQNDGAAEGIPNATNHQEG